MFGSVLRGQDTDSSDLDILIDPTPETTLFGIGAIRLKLRQLLGVPVDVLTPQRLTQQFPRRHSRGGSPCMTKDLQTAIDQVAARTDKIEATITTLKQAFHGSLSQLSTAPAYVAKKRPEVGTPGFV